MIQYIQIKRKEVIKMTVKEIKSAVAHMKDDDEVKFISSYSDYEGWLS